ncbi:MAG: hypothetical protein LBQ33_06260, partial [Oscillospiraceae bacterium]|nr:hypothetical protein [Oscillospiraceae bacterium]
MKIIFRYLKPYMLIVVLALALLWGQAFGELTMPNLMSNIVTVGLQGGGLEESIPKRLSAAGMQTLQAFMPPEHAAVFGAAYEAQPDGSLAVKTQAAADSALGEYYGRAAFFLMNKATQAAKQMPQTQAADLREVEPAQFYALTALLRLDPKLPEEIKAASGQELDSMLYSQVGTAMIRLFYQELGMDTGAIQREYIFREGARMLLLALGIGLAAVAVSLLSARISTGLARDMRRSVFARVQLFSKNELDRFSTASLITRSTNDVQQVQMLVLMGIRM